MSFLYKLFNKNYELQNINEDNIQYFTFKNKEFIAKPVNIYDGDTFTAIFKFKDEYIKYKCRSLGYDSPEIKPLLSKPNRELEIENAKKAKERFTELLTKNKLVTIKCDDFDKYGRILVTIYNNIDNDSINNIMIKEGHGYIYNGGTKNK
jgi:endonuclease YncB( thermonuclease family)